MKSIYKIFLLALGVYTYAFSQITEITRLPVQDISQSIKESAPLWLSENEIMVFYLSEYRDTIFSTKSSDRGISWGQPKVISIVNISLYQNESFLACLKSSSGRVFFAWSIYDESMKIIYSDDNGNNWSDPISVLGGGGIPALQKKSSLLNLTEWDNGKLCLSFFNSGLSTSYYKLSTDMGINWSEEAFEFPATTGFETRELSIISSGGNNLLAVFENYAVYYTGIYSRISNDNGNSWEESRLIVDEIYHEKRPKISKLLNGNIVLTYLRDNINAVYHFEERDVYYKISQDYGISWSEETQFTRYAGEDFNTNVSSIQNNSLITFSSERYSTNFFGKHTYQILYGILEESVDQFTPPVIYNISAPFELIDENKNTFVFRAKVFDDEAVSKVVAVMEDSIYIGEMFDDGMHYDGEANDSVYGNAFPIIYPRYLNGYRMNINKLNLPFDNKGVLADVNVYFGQKAVVLANDVDQNQSVYYKEVQIGAGSSGVYDGGSFLFSAGFFISGYANGILFANGVATSSLVEDYQPGEVNSLPDDPLNVLYVVNKSDPPFGNSWKKWRDAVSLGADFYDGDGDGIFNPVDKNLNGTWDTLEDMPPLVGDEIVWCVYNDGVPADERRFEVDPIGIEVEQTLFASNIPDLENVIFIKYRATNTGLVSDVLDSVYFSPADDTDIGDATNDLGGCDTLLNSVFTFNSLVDAVYGNNPPAVYTSVLQGPVQESTSNSDTAYIRNGIILGEEIFPGYKNLVLYSFTGYAKSNTQGDPQNVQHVWNYVHAKDRQGNMLNPCDTVYGKVYGNVDCNQVNPMFWFSGDPVTKLGWLDKTAMDDRKFSSIGPLTLEKNKPAEIILALVVGRGTDNLNSITIARENVRRAILEYKSNFTSMTYTPPPAIPVTTYVLYQNYPNPFNPITTIRYELPQDGQVTIELFDILGQKVKTILNEFKRADRYEVTFNSAGLASGVYIYQLRVNDFITSKKMVMLK